MAQGIIYVFDVYNVYRYVHNKSEKIGFEQQISVKAKLI